MYSVKSDFVYLLKLGRYDHILAMVYIIINPHNKSPNTPLQGGDYPHSLPHHSLKHMYMQNKLIGRTD